jgi:hypothetical protein
MKLVGVHRHYHKWLPLNPGLMQFTPAALNELANKSSTVAEKARSMKMGKREC